MGVLVAVGAAVCMAVVVAVDVADAVDVAVGRGIGVIVAVTLAVTVAVGTLVAVASSRQSDEAHQRRKLKPHTDCLCRSITQINAHLGPDLRVLAERKAKEINEAYQALLSFTINA